MVLHEPAGGGGEYLLIYGTRKQRKAIKERQKAREQAQKQDKYK